MNQHYKFRLYKLMSQNTALPFTSSKILDTLSPWDLLPGFFLVLFWGWLHALVCFIKVDYHPRTLYWPEYYGSAFHFILEKNSIAINHHSVYAVTIIASAPESALILVVVVLVAELMQTFTIWYIDWKDSWWNWEGSSRF